MIELLAQNPVGPMGADFGKASPIGLLVIVLLLVTVLIIGVDLTRRMKRMRARREYAEAHGMDPFDHEAIDRAIAAETRGDAGATADIDEIETRLVPPAERPGEQGSRGGDAAHGTDRETGRGQGRGTAGGTGVEGGSTGVEGGPELRGGETR